MNEIWKDIKDYEGLYQVSNLGRVKSLVKVTNNQFGKKERILKLQTNKCGYQQICLSKNGECKYYLVHRLVYETFIGDIPEGMQVNHINERKNENRPENLNLMTPKQNMNWGTCVERRSVKRRGVYNTKLSKPINQYDLNGNFLKEWPSIREIERQLNLNCGYISSCCLGNHKQAYGYIWKYKNG